MYSPCGAVHLVSPVDCQSRRCLSPEAFTIGSDSGCARYVLPRVDRGHGRFGERLAFRAVLLPIDDISQHERTPRIMRSSCTTMISSQTAHLNHLGSARASSRWRSTHVAYASVIPLPHINPLIHESSMTSRSPSVSKQLKTAPDLYLDEFRDCIASTLRVVRDVTLTPEALHGATEMRWCGAGGVPRLSPQLHDGSTRFGSCHR